MFVKVKDKRYGTTYLINTNNIAWVCLETKSILTNGVHGEGNGLLSLVEDDFDKLLNFIDWE